VMQAALGKKGTPYSFPERRREDDKPSREMSMVR
jgi:hypothetical protein